MVTQDDKKNFILDSSLNLIKNSNSSEKIINLVRSKLKNIDNWELNSANKKLVTLNTKDKFHNWLLDKQDVYKFTDFKYKFLDKHELLNLLDAIKIESNQDYRKIVMRRYSHDISNQLTIILINLGFLKEEIESGLITSNNKDLINQVLDTSLDTSGKIKKLIEQTRENNDWDKSQVAGTSHLKISIQRVLELSKHLMNREILIICDFPEDDLIHVNEITSIRLLRLILINAIDATRNLKEPIILMEITQQSDRTIITFHDNGEPFSITKNDLYNEQFYNEQIDKVGLSLINLEKLITLVNGHFELFNGKYKHIRIVIPK